MGQLIVNYKSDSSSSRFRNYLEEAKVVAVDFGKKYGRLGIVLLVMGGLGKLAVHLTDTGGAHTKEPEKIEYDVNKDKTLNNPMIPLVQEEIDDTESMEELDQYIGEDD